MVLLYKEEWGEHRKGFKEVWGCLGTPIWNTYQEMYTSPPLVSGEELGGGWGTWGGMVLVGVRDEAGLFDL